MLQPATEFRSMRYRINGDQLTFGTTELDRMLADFGGMILGNLIELARLGAVMQDNPDRAKVLNQFADLMQSFSGGDGGK